MVTTTNFIGDTLYVASALPATNDAAGFEALTWVKVEGIQQLPQLGVTHANNDVPDLQTGFTTGIKGAGTGVESQITCREVVSDTGQANLRTLGDDAQGEGSVKIGTGTGANQALQNPDVVEYAQGYFHSFQKNQGNDTNHRGFTVTFHQNALGVTGVEPV